MPNDTVASSSDWQAQCDAARRIDADFGTQAALDYLVGEKLLGRLRLLYGKPEFSALLDGYTADLRGLFPLFSLRQYVERAMHAKRLRAPDHNLLVRVYLLIRD
jgi:hypothetical protein